MANEITVSALLRYSKGGNGFDRPPTGERKFTMSGDQHNDTVQVVPITTAAALEMGPISTNVGWVLLENLNDTNFVSLRRVTGEENFMKIKAGEFALFRLEATAPYIIADTASCNVRVTVIED